MVYVKHNWEGGREGGTPITAAALDEMEDGIDLAINQGLTVGSVTTGPVASATVSGDPGSKVLNLVLPESTEYGWLVAGHGSNGGMVYEALNLFYSADGKTVTGGYGNPLYRPASAGTSLRDPHIQKIGDTWFMAYTPNNGISKTLEVAKSTDLINWSLAATANVAATANMTWSWAPELVQDTDGSWYMFYTAVNTTVNPPTHEIWRVKATDNTLTSWGAPVKVTWTVHPGGNPLDPAFIRNGNTWYIYYGLDGVIRRATASTLAGVWTTDRAGDWAGWISGAIDGVSHAGYEGPEVVLAEPGRFRIYLDRYTSPGNTALGYIYSDSTDGMVTWTAPKAVAKGPGFPVDMQVRHGTWHKIGTAKDHEAVMAATMGTAGKVRHAEFTGAGTIAANTKWAGPFTLDAAASTNAGEFVEATGRQLKVLRDGVYSVDFFVGAGVALGGWIAVKGPAETPNYATNDIAAGAPAWSISAANLWLKAGTILEFYFNPANAVTMPAAGIRARVTKVQ